MLPAEPDFRAAALDGAADGVLRPIGNLASAPYGGRRASGRFDSRPSLAAPQE